MPVTYNGFSDGWILNNCSHVPHAHLARQCCMAYPCLLLKPLQHPRFYDYTSLGLFCFKLYVYERSALHVSAHHMHAWCSRRPEEGFGSLGIWSYRWLSASMWVLRIELWSFGRATCALNHKAISQPRLYKFHREEN